MHGSSSNEIATKMLIADDDPCVLRVIAERCTRMGFEVETASNGLEALIKAIRYHPDILVIDVHLPEIDGLSVCALLQDTARQSPHVLAMTGRPAREILLRCEGLNALCIYKGDNFWSALKTGLAEICPYKAVAIRQLGNQLDQIEVRKRPKVLLVDDDASVKKMFLHRFGGLGADLLYAVDGVQALWKARREEPTVIVSDYYMPNGDAEVLLRRLRNMPETRGIPVIVQTGRRLNDTIKQRLRQPAGGGAGAIRILQKSFDGRELFEALQRVCGFATDLDGQLLYQ